MTKAKIMLIVKVRTATNDYIWYRLSPKVVKALTIERKMNNLSFKQMANKIKGCYINIPLTNYYNCRAVIGVGEVINLKWHEFDSTMLCTRSQFVTRVALKQSLRKSYHYLRHDYGKYSRINIFVNLYKFRKTLNH